MAKLVIDVVVDDKGNVQLKGIKGHVNDLDGTLKNLNSTANMLRNAFMGLVAALGIRELYAASEAWIKLSMAQEKSDNQLKIAMINNRQFSQEFLKTTMDQAMALQRTTGINRSVIEEGQKMLMMYRRISTDELPRATQVMANMAARSGDIFLAAKALGEASQGSGRYLRNLGIAVDDEILKHKNFEEVLVILEKMLKDQALVLGMGYNKWNILGAMLDEVRKKAGDLFNEIAIGSGLLPGVIESLGGLVDSLNKSFESGKFKEWALEVSQTFLYMAKSISGFLDIVYNVFVNKFGSLLDKAAGLLNNPDFPEKSVNAAKWGTLLASSGALALGIGGLTGGLSIPPMLAGAALIGGGTALLGGVGSYLGYTLPTDRENKESELKNVQNSINALYVEQEQNKAEIDRLNNLMESTRKQNPNTIMLTPLNIDILNVRNSEINKEISQLNQKQYNLNPVGPNPPSDKISDWINSQIAESKQQLSNIRTNRVVKSIIDTESPWLKSLIEGGTGSGNPIVGPSEADLRAQEAAAKKYADALQQVNDIIAKNTMSDWELGIYKIDQEYKKLSETLGKNNKELKRARDLSKASLYSEFIEKEKTAIITSLKEQDKERQDVFDREVKLADEATALWDEYTDNFIVNILKQGESLDELVKKWNELAKKVDEARISIAERTIKDRSGWDTFFPSEKTIQAFETKSKLAIQNINEELNKNLSISGITGEQKSIFSQDAANKIADINKNLTKEMYSGWKELSDSIAGDFSSAFESILADGTGTFKKLADALRHSFAHSLSGIVEQDILKPFMNQMMAGMSGVPQGNIYPANFMGPLPPGATYASSYAPYIGAGAMGYGMGQSMGQSGIGTGLGAMGGFYALGGPGGALAGGLIGSLTESLIDAFSKEEPKFPSVGILWEVIDGQVKEVSESWKNSPRSQLLIDEVQRSLQAQIDFTKQIIRAGGGKLENFSILTGSSDLTNVGISGGPIETALVGYSQYASIFGKKFVDDFAKEFTGSFSSKRVGFWEGSNPKETFTYFNEYMAGQLPKILGATNPLQEYQKIADYSFEGQPFSSLVNTSAFEKWTETLKDKFTQITGFFGNSLSSALLDSLKTGQYASFEQNLRNSLSETIKNAVIQGFLTNEIMPLVLKSFQEQRLSSPTTLSWEAPLGEKSGVVTSIIPALWDIVSMYQKGDISLNEGLAYLGTMKDSFNTQMTGINDLLLPLIEGLNFVGTALGANTSAVSESTQKAYEEFMAQLQYGDLNPSQSIAGMMGEYNKLYSEAVINPEGFSKLAGFTGGTLLPGLKGISTETNYAGNYAGIVAQFAGLPTAWGTPSLDTASPVNPADYAMPTVAGQTQGPGFKQMVKEAFQEVVQEKLAAMLKDIADAAREDSTVTGDITIKGSIGSLMIKEIKSDTDVRMTVHNA